MSCYMSTGSGDSSAEDERRRLQEEARGSAGRSVFLAYENDHLLLLSWAEKIKLNPQCECAGSFVFSLRLPAS